MLKLGIYQHYNGPYYHALGIARHSETLEELVVYQALQGDYGIWVRPIAMFEEEVEINGKKQPRFTFIKETGTTPPELR